MNIATWLADASNELADELFTTPRLDAEVILSHTIRKPRTYLHAHGDEPLDSRSTEVANARLELRKDYVPVAYIIGHKEFYGRPFIVRPATLIPRPESEALIGHLNDLLPTSAALPGVTRKRLVDVGTGSGCLGITAKLEHPELDVDLTDVSKAALLVAERNAGALDADVATFTSDLLSDYPYSPDIIVANLPYVDRSWDVSEELRHEPEDALFAGRGGLSLIFKLLDQSVSRLKDSGYVLLEADPRQLDEIVRYAKRLGLNEVARSPFALVLQKI